MSSPQPSAIRQAWYRWKALKLPWRKRFLVGLDLQGNTYWEFKDAITAGRMRRIVQYPPGTHHSDLKLTPQWHQWLRHTRSEPPSLTEHSLDLARQVQLKVLAAKADARWAAKESYLDQPGERPLLSEERVEKDVMEDVTVTEDTKPVPQEALGSEERSTGRLEGQPEKKDPWKVARGGPSEQWQPATWGGEIAPRNR